MSLFPHDDEYWVAVAEFLKPRVVGEDKILAPAEFNDVFEQTYAYEAIYYLNDVRFSLTILHKGQLDRFSKSNLTDLISNGTPVFANEVFVVMAFRPVEHDYAQDVHYSALLNNFERIPDDYDPQEISLQDTTGANIAIELLEQNISPDQTLLLPFSLSRNFPNAIAYQGAYAFHPEYFDWVVLNSEVNQLNPSFYEHYLAHYTPVLRDLDNLVLSKKAIDGMEILSRESISEHLDRLDKTIAGRLVNNDIGHEKKTVILVTTHNRPEALNRSLPQLGALSVPVLVVDDGSDRDSLKAIKQLCEENGAELLSIPKNRGLPAALNMGISYWLADPSVEWISYFQDDVDIVPDILETIANVQDKDHCPILTGRLSKLHPTYGEISINETSVVRMRSVPGIHIHAHAKYWRKVLPIPTPYLGAPKRLKGHPNQGADEDFWITTWSPNSITKQGGYVICIPGLVRTFTYLPKDSTWGSPLPMPDEPL